MKQPRKATLFEALIPIVFLVIMLALALLKFNVDPQIPLILATGVAALIGVLRLGINGVSLKRGLSKPLQWPYKLF